MGMIFYGFYLDFYDLIKDVQIPLPLERNNDLIKPWKYDQLRYFQKWQPIESRNKLYHVSYETGIWKF